LFGGGLAILVGFVLFEIRREDPLLDVDLQRRRVIVGIVIAMSAPSSAQRLLHLHRHLLQHILGFGPLETAAAILPAALIGPYAALVIGPITDRLGARRAGDLRLRNRPRLGWPGWALSSARTSTGCWWPACSCSASPTRRCSRRC